MSMVALPTIRIKGKEYFVDERLKELRSKVNYPEPIEFINFNDLSFQDLNRVFSLLRERSLIQENKA
jgi:hypothetical protein